MSRSRRNRVEFANLHVTAEDFVLADLLSDIVFPVIFGGESRTYGSAKYSFLDQALVKTPDGNHGIAFEFVKDTSLRREQVLREGTLVPNMGEMESAPSAVVLLILESHRIVFLPRTGFAPSLRELEHTFMALFNRERIKRRNLTPNLPPIEVKLIPLTSTESVMEGIKRLTRIKSLKIDLIKTNAEIDPHEAYRTIHDAAIAAHAKRARIEYANAKDGLLASEISAEVARATSQGVANVSVAGIDEHGEDVVRTNHDMRVRPTARFDIGTPAGTAIPMARSLLDLVDQGIVSPPQVVEQPEVVADAFDRWRDSPSILTAPPLSSSVTVSTDTGATAPGLVKNPGPTNEPSKQ